MLIEDLKAFNEAISKRIVKVSVDSIALKALQEAAYEHITPDGFP